MTTRRWVYCELPTREDIHCDQAEIDDGHAEQMFEMDRRNGRIVLDLPDTKVVAYTWTIEIWTRKSTEASE